MKKKKIDWNSEHTHHNIKLMARKGALSKEIAAELGCSESTLSKRKKEIPALKKALEEGRELSVNINFHKVENSLIKLCVGFETRTEEVQIERKGTKKDLAGNDVPIYSEKKKVTKKYHVPNVAAIIFYLSNNHPELYQNIRDGKESEDIRDKGVILDYFKDMRSKGDELHKGGENDTSK